ncbi:MAG: hypothetical protein MI861_06140 [Pirellulales bacterium]|nr:hypothetical protein [Pirellulales bacterium]
MPDQFALAGEFVSCKDRSGAKCLQTPIPADWQVCTETKASTLTAETGQPGVPYPRYRLTDLEKSAICQDHQFE